MKVCLRCGSLLPLDASHYRACKECKDGFHNICKECTKLKRKEWDKKNKNTIKEQKKRYAIENAEHLKAKKKLWNDANKDHNKEVYSKWWNINKEDKKKKSRQWKENNPDKVKEHRDKNRELQKQQSEIYRIENRDKIRERGKDYRRNNKTTVNIATQKRRTLKKSLPATLTKKQWGEIKSHFKNKCAYCGEFLPLTQDHFVPLSSGGEYTINNIIPACVGCNCSKNKFAFNDWYPSFKHYSESRERKILNFLNYDDNTQQLSMI